MTASVRFNGTVSAYANSAPVSGLPVTMMAWIWMQSLGASHVAGLYDGSANENIILGVGRAGGTRLARTTSANASLVIEYDPGSDAYWTGNWRHFASTMSESGGTITGHLYLDGEQVATGSAAGTPVTATAIGVGSRTNGTNYWDLYANAYVRRLMTFNSVLTGDQIRDIYLAGPPDYTPTSLHELASDYTEAAGGTTLSTNGSPAFSVESPPIYTPSRMTLLGLAGGGDVEPADSVGWLVGSGMASGLGFD